MRGAAVGPGHLAKRGDVESLGAHIATPKPIVASIEQRATRFDLIEREAKHLFGPLTRSASKQSLERRRPLAGEHLGEQRGELGAAAHDPAPELGA